MLETGLDTSVGFKTFTGVGTLGFCDTYDTCLPLAAKYIG